MSFYLCPNCLFVGYCKHRTLRIVSDADLSNPEYLRDLRNFAFSLQVSDTAWHDFIVDLYRDYSGRVIGNLGQEVFLDFGEFERLGIREWFRDFCCRPCSDQVKPRLRSEARERVRVLATVLTAHFPVEALLWGVRPANDNWEPANN